MTGNGQGKQRPVEIPDWTEHVDEALRSGRLEDLDQAQQKRMRKRVFGSLPIAILPTSTPPEEGIRERRLANRQRHIEAAADRRHFRSEP